MHITESSALDACTDGARRTLWERVYPRSRQRGGWHGLRPCSRV